MSIKSGGNNINLNFDNTSNVGNISKINDNSETFGNVSSQSQNLEVEELDLSTESQKIYNEDSYFTQVKNNIEKYSNNIKIDDLGKVTIIMTNDGLTNLEKSFKAWCESKGTQVEVICYKVDENGNYNLTVASPELQEKEQLLIDKCAEEGINITITEDTRTVDEQNKIYASGRTEEGSWLTDQSGDGYCSDHQWGIAFDIYIEGENGVNTYTDESYAATWEKVGEIGKEIGLGWGGDWQEYDAGHFYLSDYVLNYTDDTKTSKVLTVKEEVTVPGGNNTYKITTYDNPAEFSKTWKFD